MEFLVRLEITVPEGVAEAEVARRERAEAAAAAALVEQGHLLRVWKLTRPGGEDSVLGLYRADGSAELDALLEGLPLYEWMHIEITPLDPHPNDPNAGEETVMSDGSRR
jgi:muconolactone D-isomerase